MKNDMAAGSVGLDSIVGHVTGIEYTERRVQPAKKL